MSTLLTHVYYIQNKLNRGIPSKDNRISNRVVAHALKQSRNRLLKTKLDRKDYISDSNYQKICIPLELHSFHDCDCVAFPDECKLKRSVYEIPEPVVAKCGTTFQALSLDGRKIPLSSVTTNQYSEYSLSANNKLSSFLEEKNVYIINGKKLTMILGKAIFADPELAVQYMTQVCNEYANCSSYFSEEFPIDPDLTQLMYTMALQDLAETYKFPLDDKNDSRVPEQVQSTDPNEVTRR